MVYQIILINQYQTKRSNEHSQQNWIIKLKQSNKNKVQTIITMYNE